MGYGDEIMATGEVRRLAATDSRRVQIVNAAGVPRWSDVWAGNPRIVRPGEVGDFRLLPNAGGCRPYIDYQKSTRIRWAYTDWRCTPGELFGLADDGRAKGLVLVEPELKSNASPNKQWGRHNWQALVDSCPHIKFGQMGPFGTRWLRGVTPIVTNGFMQAAAVLAHARALVLPEGGLHHAAAALERHAIVLFGAATSPANTGYDIHDNVWVEMPAALGWRTPNALCARAWKQITPDRIRRLLERTLASKA